ncbi:hypothetical protein IAT38_001107 [Cryptococcus sp. DSM 104549]
MAVSNGVNLLLLIELAAVVIGSTAFLFYWNRLLASVLTFLARLYTWRVHHAYLTIGSLQISPLAGRISFRDAEYHSSNLSVRALTGHITWRYWKIRIRSEADTQSTNTKRNKLPCRIVVYAKGVECFVYNRTPAYDAIVERMKKHEKEEENEEETPRPSEEARSDGPLRARLRNLGRMSTKESSEGGLPFGEGAGHEYPPTPVNDLPAQVKPVASKPANDGVNWFREALPLELKIVTGSVVLGSDATPTVLIGDFSRADGTLEVSDARSVLDLYKMAINLTFYDAKVLTRTNVDYSGPLLAHGKKVYDELLKQQAELALKPPSAISIFTGFHLLAKQFPFLHDPKFSTPPVAGLPTDRVWKGLARYRLPEENAPKTQRREEREYAKVTTWLETPELNLVYHADTPAYVDSMDEVGNVDLPPEYGIDITINKGNIKYGPWADRQSKCLAKADNQLSMTMPTPLEWDAQRDWGMDVVFDNPSVNLLRDHVTLISDLSRDWSTGTTGGDYHHFVPNHYNFRVSFINYAFHLYINDYNIVDAPGSRDGNAYLDIYGPRLDAVVAVASTHYRPETSVVPFTVTATDGRIELGVPKWDTHRVFGSDVSEAGKIGELVISGSYRYYAIPKPEHQETLTLHIEGKDVVFKALGWVLRRLFCVKDNYFGQFTQFTTMHEFLERYDHDPGSVGDPVEEKYRAGRSDPFTVLLTMDIQDSLILMSDEIYNCRQGLAIPVPQLQMVLKSVEQFMELSLDLTPTYVIAVADFADSYQKGVAPLLSSDEAIFIEGLELKANRLFGPQPRATTYLCLWEAVLPKISAFLNPAFVATLQAAGRAVVYTFSDPDNAPDKIYSLKSPPDVTFFKLSIDQALGMLTAGNDAASFEAHKGIVLDTSTCGTKSYSSTLGVLLPSLTVNLLHRLPKRTWHVVSTATVDASLDVYKAPLGWEKHVSAQQEFLKEEDGPTGRIWYMYGGGQKPKGRHVDGMYLPLPMEDTVVSHDEEPEETPAAKEEDYDMMESSELSSDDSREEFDLLPHPKNRRRARSFMTAQETVHSSASSIGDESDSVSSSSSTEGSLMSVVPDHYTALGDALTEKLRYFRFAHTSRHGHHHHGECKGPGEEEEGGPVPGVQRAVEAGTVVRVKTQKVHVNLCPNGVPTALKVMTAMTVDEPDYDKRLDALLVSHLDAVRNERRVEQPNVFDLHLPSIIVQLASDNRSTSLITHIEHVRCNLYRHSPIDSHPVLDLVSSVTSVTATALTPDAPISLREAAGIPMGTPSSLPVAQVFVAGLEVGVHRSHGLRVHGKVAKTHVNAVTPVVGFAQTFSVPWQTVIANADLSPCESTADARMLYHIIKSAVESQRGTYLPSFAYVSAYGLHIQDTQLGNRKQTGWWLLARFRDWLRGARLAPLGEEPSEEEMGRYIVEQLLKVEDTVSGAENVVRSQHFFEKVFGPAAPSADNSKPDGPVDLFIYSGDLRVNHYGRPLKHAETSTVTSFINVQQTSIGCALATGAAAQGKPAAQMRFVAAVKGVGVEVHDSVMTLARVALRALQARAESEAGREKATEDAAGPKEAVVRSIIQDVKDAAATKRVVKDTDGGEKPSVVVLDFQIDSVSVDAVGGGLRLHFGARQVHLTTMLRTTPLAGPGTNLTTKEAVHATCGEVGFILSETVGGEDRVAASLKTEGWNALVDRFVPLKKGPAELKVVLGLKQVNFETLPLLTFMYAFVKRWKQEELPLYAPPIEEMKSILASLKSPSAPSSASSAPAPSQPCTLTSLDVSLQSLHARVQATKGLWLRWDIEKVFGSRQMRKKEMRFAIRIAPQVASADDIDKPAGKKRTRTYSLPIPSITIVGSHSYIKDRAHVSADISVGVFTGKLKPVVLERLMGLHNKLIDDLTAVLRGLQEDLAAMKEKLRGRKSEESAEPPSLSPRAPASPLYDIHVGVDGVRVTLCADGVPADVLVEAIAIKGHMTNRYDAEEGLFWKANVDQFCLSLGHSVSHPNGRGLGATRRLKTASMSLDVDVTELPANSHNTSRFEVNLSHVHMVMHAEALSELADLLKSWYADIRDLQEWRPTEVKEVKETTAKVLKKFESAEGVPHSDVSWLSNRLLQVNVSGVGVAIPLVAVAAMGDGGHSHVPALLFSIRVITFQNTRNQTARFKMQTIALQFIDNFDQISPEHYTGDFFGGRNCMLLPSIQSEAEMSSTGDAWQLSAHWSATDFKLTLGSDVADGVFKLVGLFAEGKEKIARVGEIYRAQVASQTELLVAKGECPATPVPSPPRASQRIHVRMSFTFNSGIVELLRDLSETERKNMGPDTRRGRAALPDTVVLPTVSVWVDYVEAKTTPMPSDDDANDGLLLLNFAVHESRNLLRPTILPFFWQTVKNFEKMAKPTRVPTTPAPSPDIVHHSPKPVSPTTPEAAACATAHTPPTARTKVRVTLRIDQSELRLSCAPDSNAYVDLKWESGGFLATTTIGGPSNYTVAGTISGVTAYLRHEFAEEGRSCIKAGAKDLAFSVALCPEDRRGVKGLSVVLDTQLSAQFRLEQFSAWLAFAAVWVDNAPSLDLPDRTAAEPLVAPSPVTLQPPKLGIVALVRFRTVDFDANVGVTNARLEMTPIVLRTKSNGVKTDVDLSVGVTQITAKGDISGEIRSESLVFHTSRQSSRSSASTDPTVLSMSIDAGVLSGSLSMQDLNVIRFSLDPAKVTLEDDWEAFSRDPSSQVILSFAVKAGVFRSVVRLLAIPSMLNKFYSVSNTIESQERMASNRSNTYKSQQLRKSTEPSPMAAVILHTARKAGQTLSSTATVKTAQSMCFDLGGVDIGLFNAPVSEDQRGDFYRFMIGKVGADLKRQLSKDDLPKRDLSLMVSYVEWISSDGTKAAKEVKRDLSLADLIQAASLHGKKEIASLPMMTMDMKSIEEPKPPVVVYDFDLLWGKGDLDIAIMPYFFEQVYKTFHTLIEGLDQEQVTKVKRRGDDSVLRDRGRGKGVDGLETEKANAVEGANQLTFRRRLEGNRPLPVPRLRLLGEATGEAMAWVPKINAANEQLPIMVHRFVTLPLEEGMDLLLKLYEKQLPDTAPQ